MARVSLTLLGGFEVRLDDQIVDLSMKKGQALLAYLSTPTGRPHPRDKLAALLWGEVTEPAARARLRQALFVLRRGLGEPSPLRMEDETVALDRDQAATDVEEFERCAIAGTRAGLERAAVLYRGELLEGLALMEPTFEEWLVGERRRLRERALVVLDKLLALQRDAGSLETAAETALRLVALDPVQEHAHRTLMRLHAQLGRRPAALRHYQIRVSALQRELRAEPRAEAKPLYREPLPRPLSAQRAGPTEPAIAAELLPQHDSPAPAAPGSEWPMVGRAQALGQLRDALQTAWSGRARLASVIGEAGIGKSRLVAEFGAEALAMGGRVAGGHCHESEQVLAFAPWVEALRSGGLVDHVTSLRPAWRTELGRLLPEIADPPPAPTSDGATQLFEAVADLLDRAASARPVLLFLEDVHWADEMTLRLLAFIGRRLANARPLIVVTAREEDLPHATALRRALEELAAQGGLVRCPLGPLGRDETRMLARTLVTSSEADRLEEPLWRASEGNPFMIVEMVRAHRAGLAAGDPALSIPERVRKLVAIRIERLGDRAKRLAALAAVIGRPFEWTLLQRAAGLDETQTAEGVEELVRRRILLFEGERLQFAHDHVREVVEREIFPARRIVLHRSVAETLEQIYADQLDAHAFALGTHYREGEAWAKAVHYLQRAARQASLRYAQREAVACYEQALTALARIPDRASVREEEARLQFRRAHSLYLSGEFERARMALSETEDLGVPLGDRRFLAEVHASKAVLLASAGELAAATQSGLRAFSIASSLGDRGLEMSTSISLGRVYYARGDLPPAIECM